MRPERHLLHVISSLRPLPGYLLAPHLQQHPPALPSSPAPRSGSSQSASASPEHVSRYRWTHVEGAHKGKHDLIPTSKLPPAALLPGRRARLRPMPGLSHIGGSCQSPQPDNNWTSLRFRLMPDAAGTDKVIHHIHALPRLGWSDLGQASVAMASGMIHAALMVQLSCVHAGIPAHPCRDIATTSWSEWHVSLWFHYRFLQVMLHVCNMYTFVHIYIYLYI